MPRRIVVTSALPGEGKSTIAANLAAAYTRIGRRTVLVECDFRRPAQGAIHGVRGRGLLAWAKDGFAMSDDLLEPNGPVGLRVLADGTALIPAGSSDIQPARYLSSESMVRFFERLGAEFEVVIVDTPPAGVFRDALMIARGCDETVLVARDGVANTELLTRVLNDFAKTRAPAIGMILNGFSANAKHPQLGYHQLYRKYDYNAPRKVALETT